MAYNTKFTWNLDRIEPSLMCWGWTDTADPKLKVDDIEQTAGTDFEFARLMDYDAGTADNHTLAEDDVIVGATSGATATLKKFTVANGSWAGDDAAGTLYIISQTGTFQDNENLLVGSDVWGVVNGTQRILITQAGDVDNTTVWEVADSFVSEVIAIPIVMHHLLRH